MRHLLELALDVIFPPLCPVCGHAVTGRVFCADCLAALPPPPPPRPIQNLDAYYAALSYEGAAAEVVRRLKFNKRTDAAHPLAALMACALPADAASRIDLITFIPLHKLRERERGFNQSRLLAAALAERLRLPMCATLERSRATAPSYGLSPKERAANVDGAFCMIPAANVHNKHILLTDDVLTTGATASAAAAVLRRAGAASVSAVTAAATAQKPAEGTPRNNP